MNSYQWQIYNFITKKGVVSSEELCDELDIETDDDSIKRNLSRKSMALYKEIEKINDDPEINKVILWDDKGNYWITKSQEDTEKFVNRIYRKPALKKLAKMYLILTKGKKDRMGKLFSNDLRPINECPYAKEFVESFANELEIEREIAYWKSEINSIENDNNKYVNGRLNQLPKIQARIKELEELLDESNNNN